MHCLPSFCFYKKREQLVIINEVNYENTIKFIPPITFGKVIKVYDGDTITIANKMPYKTSTLYRFSVRLRGIDCPEIRSKNENEKRCAYIARDFVSNLIMGKIVILKDIDLDKYGRILANVIINGSNLSDLLIEKGLAVVYDGRTKVGFSNEKLKSII
jgi:endonuclease YncB( thermonuclease family)